MGRRAVCGGGLIVEVEAAVKVKTELGFEAADVVPNLPSTMEVWIGVQPASRLSPWLADVGAVRYCSDGLKGSKATARRYPAHL